MSNTIELAVLFLVGCVVGAFAWPHVQTLFANYSASRAVTAAKALAAAHAVVAAHAAPLPVAPAPVAAGAAPAAHA